MDIQKQILINTLIYQQVVMTQAVFISWVVFGTA
ncbi:uncharacterized protein METZ01_LOCUS353867 [marine metagenome]|uniref:Uncharacterized protein n=1 Tax=marine metagenome TaxID=408172 RepID=A0A382RTL1_9ZZZZ